MQRQHAANESDPVAEHGVVAGAAAPRVRRAGGHFRVWGNAVRVTANNAAFDHISAMITRSSMPSVAKVSPELQERLLRFFVSIPWRPPRHSLQDSTPRDSVSLIGRESECSQGNFWAALSQDLQIYLGDNAQCHCGLRYILSIRPPSILRSSVVVSPVLLKPILR